MKNVIRFNVIKFQTAKYYDNVYFNGKKYGAVIHKKINRKIKCILLNLNF